VGVHDGDTLTLLDAQKRQTKVRLAEIGTPESAQPYGSRSKQALSDLAFGKAVQIKVRDIDRYGRTVGRVSVNGTDVMLQWWPPVLPGFTGNTRYRRICSWPIPSAPLSTNPVRVNLD